MDFGNPVFHICFVYGSVFWFSSIIFVAWEEIAFVVMCLFKCLIAINLVLHLDAYKR